MSIPVLGPDQANGLAPVYPAVSAGPVAQASIATLLATAARNACVVAAMQLPPVSGLGGGTDVKVWEDTGKELSLKGTLGLYSDNGGQFVAVTALDSDTVAVASVGWGTAGELLLNLVKIDATGKPGLVGNGGQAEGGQFPYSLTPAAITTLDATHFATAITDGSNPSADGGGPVIVSLWEVVAPPSPIQFVAQFSTGAGATQLAIATVPPGGYNDSSQVVTALRNQAGDLEVILWAVGGAKVERLASANAGGVSQVAIAPWKVNPDNQPQVVTAVVNSAGKLELLIWEVSGDAKAGFKIAAIPGATGGGASEAAICPMLDCQITAVVDEANNLSAEVWGGAPFGFTFHELLSYNTSLGITNVAVAGAGNETNRTTGTWNGYFFTAARATSSGDLQIQKWSFTAPPTGIIK